MIATLAIFAFFMILGIGIVTSVKMFSVWTVACFVIAMGECFILFRTFSFRVRKATFYDDTFRIVEGLDGVSFNYSQVRHVMLLKGIWLGRAIVISLIGVEQPLTILGNPKNSSMAIDLYSWLKQKMEQNKAALS